MATPTSSAILDRVRYHAFQQLAWEKRQKTNLYLDARIFESGERIGPRREETVVDRPSILVFADDEPFANFSHPCRYLLYDAKSGDLYREKPAQFPPFEKERPRTLQVFHEPSQWIEKPNIYKVRPYFRCPILLPEGTRYAILYAGMSNKRHLNDMEFLYRTLVDLYAFNPAHIYALSFDGTLNTQDGVQTHWPGDNSAYRIHITGSGTRADLEAAIDDLKGKIKSQDVLLIHTNNHGGWDGAPGTANLCTYPSWDGYYANDFAAKLAELPHFRKLIVMMEQCHAGGFNAPIIAHSPATDTSVASAAIESLSSWVSPDGNWDPCARDWIAAQAGHDPFGGALAFNPDGDGDGIIQAEEAFNYANLVKDPRDTPNFSENSEAGGDIALGQDYTIYWGWWCRILFEVLERHYIKLPPEEYYDRLHKVLPELTKLALALDETTRGLNKEYQDKIQAIITPVFGQK
jgi:hypothetical protein